MHIGMLLRLATSRILEALLLAVVAIVMVIPGSDVAFSQSGTGSPAQAPLFTAIDLTSKGVYVAYAISAVPGPWGFLVGSRWGGLSPSSCDITRCCGTAARRAWWTSIPAG